MRDAPHRTRRAARGPAPDGLRALEVDVALRLEGYEWVRWAREGGPDIGRDRGGRFLAPPHHLLAHLWVPASRRERLAPQPFRYLPPYTSDVDSALQACERAGLFRDASASLRRRPDGAWRIELPGAGLELEDDSLALLLCRAGLAWSDRRRIAASGT